MLITNSILANNGKFTEAFKIIFKYLFDQLFSHFMNNMKGKACTCMTAELNKPQF
jgi:hypothetical protein